MVTESDKKAVQNLLQRETVITTGSNLLVPVIPNPGQLLGPDGKPIRKKDAGSRTRGKQQQ